MPALAAQAPASAQGVVVLEVAVAPQRAVAPAQLLQLRAALGQRTVEIDVAREQGGGSAVVPALDQAVDRVARGEQAGICAHRPPGQRGLARDQLERAPHRPLATRVRDVGEQDHAEPRLGHPAHERAEPGQSAGVADVALTVALVPDHEPVAVAAGHHSRRLGQRRPLDARPERAARTLHLAQRRAAHGRALGGVAGRLGVQEHTAPARQVAHAAVEPAERGEVATVGQRHLRREALAGRAVARRDSLRRQVAGAPDRVGEPERLQHALAHDVLVAAARDGRHDAAERRPAVVGVLEVRARRARARRRRARTGARAPRPCPRPSGGRPRDRPAAGRHPS